MNTRAAPLGRPLTVRLTIPLKPLVPVARSATCTSSPWITAAGLGVSVRPKSCDNVTVNGSGPAAVPPPVVRVIGPVVAPSGTVVVSDVAVTALRIARVPLNRSWLSPGANVLKCVPVIVTAVPIGPLVGEKPVIVGGWMT